MTTSHNLQPPAVDLYALGRAFEACGWKGWEVHPKSGRLMLAKNDAGMRLVWGGTNDHPELAFTMLDLMERMGPAGAFGCVDVAVGNVATQGCYSCERWLVPNSDPAVILHEGEGPFRTAAIAACFIAATSQTVEEAR